MLMLPEHKIHITSLSVQLQTLLWFKVFCAPILQVTHGHSPRAKRESQRLPVVHLDVDYRKDGPSQLFHTFTVKWVPFFPSCAWLSCFLEKKQTSLSWSQTQFKNHFSWTPELGGGQDSDERQDTGINKANILWGRVFNKGNARLEERMLRGKCALSEPERN